MAVGSLGLFVVLLFALAMGVASCWGGCSQPGPTLLLLVISAFGLYVSLQGFRLAVKSSGGTALVSFLLLVPGTLLSIPTFLGTTIGLATTLVKNLVKVFT